MERLEVCRTIRESSNMDGCLIIAQTALSDFESLKQTSEADFDLHLIKPLDFDSRAPATPKIQVIVAKGFS